MNTVQQKATGPGLRRVRYDLGIWESLSEVTRRWELVRGLITRDLKVRYRNSVLGFFWSMLTPLLQMAILWFVVKFAMHVQIPNLTVKILTGLVAWTFFENGLQDSSDCVLNNRDLVKKIYFPRPALPLAVVSGNLIHFLLSLVMLLIVLAAVGDFPDPLFLFVVPLLLVQTLLIAGLGMILAAVHTFYRDIKFILIQLLRVFFFLTPVMYPAELLRQKISGALLEPWMLRLYMYNPMATIIEAYRDVLIEHRLPDMSFFLPIAVFSVLIFLVGYRVYQRFAWKFPEVI